MFWYTASVPIVFGYGDRVPFTIVPSARVYTRFSPKGPQVRVPGATFFGWLRLRHRAGFPGLTLWTANRWRLREPVRPTLNNMFELPYKSTVKFNDNVCGVLLPRTMLPAPLIGV